VLRDVHRGASGRRDIRVVEEFLVAGEEPDRIEVHGRAADLAVVGIRPPIGEGERVRRVGVEDDDVLVVVSERIAWLGYLDLERLETEDLVPVGHAGLDCGDGIVLREELGRRATSGEISHLIGFMPL